MRALRAQLTRNLGLLLAGIWFVVWGLSSFGLSFPGLGALLGLLAIAAGVMIVMGR